MSFVSARPGGAGAGGSEPASRGRWQAPCSQLGYGQPASERASWSGPSELKERPQLGSWL